MSMMPTDSVLARHAAQSGASPNGGVAHVGTGNIAMSLQHISLSFKGVQAIKDISFDVKEGVICALIGPNGAGKSSMLNVINGVYRAQEGRIELFGKEWRRITPHNAAASGIARTFQNIALFSGMTVLDNIMTGCNLKTHATVFEQFMRLGRTRTEEIKNRKYVEHIIKFLQIESIRNTPVSKLSYGLQKRVELGRALAMEPKILLLDEPMAGMNYEEKCDLSCFVLEVNREFGTTIVLIEHDMSVVMDISDHVVVMDYGKKIGDGSPDEVRNKPEVIQAYLGTTH